MKITNVFFIFYAWKVVHNYRILVFIYIFISKKKKYLLIWIDIAKQNIYKKVHKLKLRQDMKRKNEQEIIISKYNIIPELTLMFKVWMERSTFINVPVMN